MSKSYNGRAMLFWTRVDSICKKEKKALASMIPALSVSPRTFYNWRLTDRIPPAEKVLKIARLLGVSPYYLVFGEKGNPSDKPQTITCDEVLDLIERAKQKAGFYAIPYLEGYIGSLQESLHDE